MDFSKKDGYTKIDGYAKDGYIKHKFKEAQELYKKRDIKNAKNTIFNILEINPSDEGALGLLYRCYLAEKDYKSIIELLRSPNFIEDDIFLKLTSAAIKENDEELLMYLYDKYYYEYCLIGKYDEENGYIYRAVRFYLLKKFGPLLDKERNIYIENDVWKYNEDKTSLVADTSSHKMTYKENQTWNYRPHVTMSYLLARHSFECINDNSENSKFEEDFDEYYKNVEKGYFLPNFDIESLYIKVRDSIEYNKERVRNTKQGDKYIFECKECGITKGGKICNYLVVETIFNSEDIINMYPLVTSEVFDKKDLCYIVNKLDENYYNEGPKVPTGLERFNRKYGKKK